jgi:trans-AT polyketide synthase/acyltransferase/oxidoreductase domain-containing protein
MTTYVFPGQGSQFCGMGGPLFDEFPEITQCADRILGYSIKALCLENTNKLLDKTDYTQPALYTVNALSYLKKLKDSGQKPDYLAGHSLGEYSALFAANAFDFETGLRLVQKRGQLMSQETHGGMAALIGLSAAQVDDLLIEHDLQQELSIANYNSYTQVVVSGTKAAITTFEPIAAAAGASLYIPSRVSGAFHSHYMSQAQSLFHEFLKGFDCSPPTIPVIANVNANAYLPSEILTNLSAQITNPVLWRQSIEYLIDCGEITFEEIGPGKVLTGIIGRIQKHQ